MSTPLARGRLLDPDTSLATEPRLHPSILKAALSFGPAGGSNIPPYPGDPQAASYEEITKWIGENAAFLATFFQLTFDKFPLAPHPVLGSTVPDTTHETKEISGVDGNTITLHIHRPVNLPSSTKIPAVVYFHGGAMVMVDITFPALQRWMKNVAAYGSVVVIGVDFRNAWTEKQHNPYPAGLNDCASAIKWVASHKEELGISKIVLQGESGGGNLSISSAIKAKQEGWVDQIDGVFAVVPYISGVYARWTDEEKLKAGLVSLVECNGYNLETSVCGVWTKYYDQDKHATNPTAWPYHATEKELEGLPPTHIVTSELDPLRDEGIEFYRKLARAGVKATGDVKLGLTHGAELIMAGAIPEHFYQLISELKAFAYAL